MPPAAATAHLGSAAGDRTARKGAGRGAVVAGGPDLLRLLRARWLFPGRHAGQPLHPTSMRLRLSAIGIPNLPGRSRALREMLLQAPPAVVAGMLGYTAGKAEAGATYKRYAAGARTNAPAGRERELSCGPRAHGARPR